MSHHPVSAPVRRPTLNARKLQSYKMFLLILPFMGLVFLFSYFPLHGWILRLSAAVPAFGLRVCGV